MEERLADIVKLPAYIGVILVSILDDDALDGGTEGGGADFLHAGRDKDAPHGGKTSGGGRFLRAIEKGTFPDGQEPFAEGDTCVAVLGEGKRADGLHAAGDRQREVVFRGILRGGVEGVHSDLCHAFGNGYRAQNGVFRQGKVPDGGQGRRQGDGFQIQVIEGTGGQRGDARSDDHAGKLCRFGVDLLGNVIVDVPGVGGEADTVVGVVNGILRGEVAGKPICLIHGALAGQRQYPVLDRPGDVVAPGACGHRGSRCGEHGKLRLRGRLRLRRRFRLRRCFRLRRRFRGQFRLRGVFCGRHGFRGRFRCGRRNDSAQGSA